MKKGSTWYFGYKTHSGVDKGTGLVHHVKVTGANIHDVTMVAQLLTGEEADVYVDCSFLRTEKCADSVRQNKQGRQCKLNCCDVSSLLKPPH